MSSNSTELAHLKVILTTDFCLSRLVMSAPYPKLEKEVEKEEGHGYVNLPPYRPEDPPSTNSNRSQIEKELREIEDEIATLKAVLASKEERAALLKRELGLYDLDVARDDMKRATQAIIHSKPYTNVKEVVTKQWNNSERKAYKSMNSSVSNLVRSVKSSVSLQPDKASTVHQQPFQPSAPPYDPKAP
ncbi:hypothetical protein Aperf_G00000107989 [Anoplocephala perfoliata]